MKFSVATPTRNALGHLKRCVGSVHAQEGVEKEHLIQDACSSDGTVEWLKEQRGLAWRSEKDDGMYDAINRAWARAGGDVLSWLNADEQYLPGTLMAVARTFERRPEIDAVFGDYIICDADTGHPMAARREIPLRRIYVVNGVLYAASCTLFFRRALLEKGWLALDASLRDVADAKLVIALLDEGASFLHLRRYLSLFGASGQNMSTGPNALAELQKLRGETGAVTSALLRLCVRSARVLEKIVRGCYWPRGVEFTFCEDETGRSRTISAAYVTPRWKL